MKKLLLLILVLLLGLSAQSQTVFRSSKYGYTIEIPRGFTTKPGIGRNVDLKAVDRNGFSLVIVVKRLAAEAEGMNPHEMNSLSTEQLQTMLSEYGDGVEILARGNTYINGRPAFFIRYNHDELYSNSYTIFKGKYLYSITSSCTPASKAQMNPYFFRSTQSFKL